MKIQMELLSDTIFGNGISIPGGEDISVLADEQGVPFYRGSTLKGVFRETLIGLLEWKSCITEEAWVQANALLGESGDDRMDSNKVIFEDENNEEYNTTLNQDIAGTLKFPYGDMAAVMVKSTQRGYEGPPHVYHFYFVKASK